MADIEQEAMSRDVDLVEVFNLRDLGGYRTGDGQRVRWGRLYRGAGLHRLAGADLETVARLGWTTVIDLRTADELARHGPCPTERLSASFHHLPMLREVWDVAQLDTTVAAEKFLLARYQEMLVEGAPALRETVALLSRAENLPAVFYCAAGKDRTGVMAAVLLDALGVDAETIAHDYHLSKERVDRIRARARGRGEATTMVAQPEAFMQAPVGAMRLLLAWLAQAHGGAAGYLRSIGVDDAELAALRAHVLEAGVP